MGSNGVRVALAFCLAGIGMPFGAETASAGSQCGKAAWYDLEGTTASGERSDGDGLTAAHRSLPFGSRVKVENLGNGRSVIVRVNDRGPFVNGRVIDVTRAAAEKLGFVSAGIARVRVSVVGGKGQLNDSCGGTVVASARKPAAEDAKDVRVPTPAPRKSLGPVSVTYTETAATAGDGTELDGEGDATISDEVAIVDEAPADPQGAVADALALRFRDAFAPPPWSLPLGYAPVEVPPKPFR